MSAMSAILFWCIRSRILKPNCKIDPKVIEIAENLLGKHRSLDNTDLTIAILNPQLYRRTPPTNQYEPLQSYFDNQPNHQLSPNSPNSKHR